MSHDAHARVELAAEHLHARDIAPKWLRGALVLTLVSGAGCAAAWALDAHRFAFSYLFAFAVVASLLLGSLFFVFIQHLTMANWSVTVRRLAETFSAALPLLALLFLPVLFNVSHVYEWAGGGHHEDDTHHAASGTADETHAENEHAGVVHTPQETALHHHIVEHKKPYLNQAFWVLRSLAYLLVWALLGTWFLRISVRQDSEQDAKHTARARTWSPLAAIAFGLSLTFAAFDWLMSLEPSWYSTIFGVVYFAGAAMSAHALLILVTFVLKTRGLLGESVNVEHYHDMGKLMFAFMCFWAYVSFSQYMLIWYAAIPEELTFFHRRWTEPSWKLPSVLLMLGHFAVPFVLIMSRIVKRRLGWIATAAGWLLLMQVFDVYWYVMPYADAHFSPSWIDAVALLFTLSAVSSAVLWIWKSVPLIALGDPRLRRSLNFVNA